MKKNAFWAKPLSVFLAFVLSLMCFPASVLAADGDEGIDPQADDAHVATAYDMANMHPQVSIIYTIKGVDYSQARVDELHAQDPNFVVPNGSKVAISIGYDPSGITFGPGDTIVYAIPSEIFVDPDATGYSNRTGTVSASGQTAGTYSIDFNQATNQFVVTIALDEEYLKTHDELYSGEINFDGSVNYTVTPEPTHPLVFPGVGTINIPTEHRDIVNSLTLAKQGKDHSGKWVSGNTTFRYNATTGESYGDYRITVTAPTENYETMTNVVVKDTVAKPAMFKQTADGHPDYTNLKVPAGTTFAWSEADQAWVWTIGNVAPGQSFTVEYRATFTDEACKSSATGSKTSNYGPWAYNTATVYSNGSKMQESTFGYRAYIDIDTAKSATTGLMMAKDAAGNPYYYISFRVVVTAHSNNGFLLEHIYFDDFLSKNASYAENDPYYLGIRNIQISGATWENGPYIHGWGSTSPLPVTYSGNKGFNGTITSLAPGKKATITYDVIVDPNIFLEQDATTGVRNGAKASVANVPSDEPYVNVTMTEKSWVQKVSETLPNGMVRYDLKVNPPSSANHPVPTLSEDADITISDDMAPGWVYCDEEGNTSGVILVTKTKLAEDGRSVVGEPEQFTINLADVVTEGTSTSGLLDQSWEYDFAGGWSYTVTYYAERVEGNIAASLSNEAGANIYNSTTGEYYEHKVTEHTTTPIVDVIEKKGTGITFVADPSDDSKGSGTATWEIAIDHSLRPLDHISDTLATDQFAQRFTGAEFGRYVTDEFGQKTFQPLFNDVFVVEVSSNGVTAAATYKGETSLTASKDDPIVIRVSSSYTASGLVDGSSIVLSNKVTLTTRYGDTSADATQSYYVTNNVSKEGVGYGEGYMWWGITVNNTGSIEGDATLTDLLPAGFTFDDIRIWFAGDKAGNVTFEYVVQPQNDGRELLTVQIHGLTKTDDTSGAVTFILTTKLADDSITTSNVYNVNVTNDVTLTTPEGSYSDEATQSYSNEVLSKEGYYNQSSAPNASYKVIVNASNVDMLADQDTITLVDVMDDRLLFLPDTLVVKDADGNKVAVDNPVYDTDTNTVTLVVPDDQTLVITYSCYVYGEPANEEEGTPADVLKDVLNTVTFQGYPTSAQRKFDITVFKPRASVTGATRFSIAKTNSYTGAALAGVDFELFEVGVADGELTYKSVGVKTTNAYGRITFSLLSEDKVYCLHEVQVPDGFYDTRADMFLAFKGKAITADMKAAGLWTNDGTMTDEEMAAADPAMQVRKIQNDILLPVTNSPFVGNIALTKVDGKTGAALPGAVFAIFSDEDCTVRVATMPATDAQGATGYQKLLVGTYYVKEMTAPAGYVLSDQVYTVEVTKDQTAVVGGKAITNTPQRAQVIVGATKTVGGGVPQEVFSFELKAADGTVLQTKQNVAGTVTFDALTYGYADVNKTFTYTVSEVAGDAGYDYDTTVYTVQVTVKPSDTEILGTEVVVTAGGQAVNGIFFDNTPLTSVTVNKVWADDDNRDGLRDSYTVALFANGEKVTGSEVTLGADELTYTWSDLAAVVDGKTVTYAVQETGVPQGYTSSTANGPVAANADGVVTVTNTHNPATTQVTATKEWDDEALFGIPGYQRPEITFVLYGMVGNDKVVDETSAVADEDSRWEATWSDLPVKADGQTIAYYVYEIVPDDYECSVIEGEGVPVVDGKVTIKNVAITSDITGSDDEINPVELKLKKTDTFAGGVLKGAIYHVVGPGVDEDFPATGEDGLAAFSFDMEGTYTITEVQGPEGYGVSSDSWTIVIGVEGPVEVKQTADGFVRVYDLVIDTQKSSALTDGVLAVSDDPIPTEVTVTKVWNDDDNRDGKRDSFEVTLYADGEAVAGSAHTMTADEESYTWTNLPSYKNGQPVTYTVVETKVPAEYASSTAEAAAAVEDGVATITNTYTPGRMEVIVTKAWEDDLLTGIEKYERPEVTFTLYGMVGDKQVVDERTAVANADSRWQATWTDLFIMAEGQPIEYYVYETLPSGYECEIVEGAAALVEDGVVTITNEPMVRDDLAPVELTIVKSDELTGTPLAGAIFHVAGPQTDVDLEATAEDGTVTFAFAYDGTYTITEAQAPEGYVTSQEQWTVVVAKGEPVDLTRDEDGTFVRHFDLSIDEAQTAVLTEGALAVENPAVPISITVKKEWDDKDNLRGARAEFEFTLYENGEAIDSVVLDPEVDESYTWTDLPSYKDGQKVEYSVAETQIPARYKASATESAPLVVDEEALTEDGVYEVTITNSYIWYIPGTADGTPIVPLLILMDVAMVGLVLARLMARRYRHVGAHVR